MNIQMFVDNEMQAIVVRNRFERVTVRGSGFCFQKNGQEEMKYSEGIDRCLMAA
jgi:hypothetical protein